MFTNFVVVKNLITFPLKQSIVLDEFFNDLDKSNKLNTQNKKPKKKKNVYDTAADLYNDLQETYFKEYYDLSDSEGKKWKTNMILIIHFLKHIIMMSGLKMKN